MTLHDEQRAADLVDAVQGRDALLHRPHRRVALVAVLHAPEILAVGLRVLEEADQIRDADHVDPRPDALAVEGEAREHHVSAVGAAPHRYAVLVEIGPRSDEVERRADVGQRLLA